MNNLFKILLVVLISSGLFKSQIAIGKATVSNDAVSLEFGEGRKGLILPYVTDALSMQDVVEGTIVFDVATKKVKYSKGLNQWEDLTLDEVRDFTYGGVVIPTTMGYVDVSLQNGLTEVLTKKSGVIIGKKPDDEMAAGILILSDSDKAMILPKIDSPHLNIVNPATGMLVYDTKTNQLAVFNGTVWTFWKP